MLKLFNDLKPFFNDNYRRIHVREFARLQKISAPTASKLLEEYHHEGVLKKEIDKQYFYYYTDKDSPVFVDIQRIYWRLMFEKLGLLKVLSNEFFSSVVILFGSLSKAEVTPNSDIDLAIFTPTKKEISLNTFEKKLGRTIQLFIFKNKDDVKNKELLNNILSGYKLRGVWS
ncbi:nucleotidyltransferase domain-containing protein [Candidatus Woesearchaeota archaeon]|nr:nucleotidyltransferase domain-containing protein [Candidatus Woesearchaeota archaeon]